MYSLSTITIKKETRMLLEKIRKFYEVKAGRPITWDEFFQAVFTEKPYSKRYVLDLSEEEAATIIEVVIEERLKWRKRV